MKKRICSAALVLAMLMATVPAMAARATYPQNDGTIVVVTETGIKTDSVFNTEGYASLSLDETGETPPQYALVDAGGSYVFPYGAFPCSYSLFGGIFVNGIVTERHPYGSDGVYSLFDLSGRQVIEESYDYLTYYNGYGLALSRSTDETDYTTVSRFLIDEAGETVMTLPDVFNLVTNAGGGDFMFEYRSWFESYYGSVGGYGEGLLWMYTGVDISQNIAQANTLTAEDISPENLYGFTYGGPHCGYIDLEGNVVIAQQYNSVYPFTEGLACVEGALETVTEEWYGYTQELIKGKYGYIDKEGNVVIDFQYSDGSSFSGGYAYVADANGKYGYIDKEGAVAVPFVYDTAYGAGDGLFSVGNIVGKTTNSWGTEVDAYKHGYTDANGTVVVPLIYDDVTQFINGVAYAINDGTLYVLTIEEDVPSDWAQVQVAAAIEADLVPAHLQSNYTGTVSRGNVAQMFIDLIEQVTGGTIDAFMDGRGVSINEDAFIDTNDAAVLAANALGIINGIGGGKFNPDGVFTRGEIAAIINRVAKVLGAETEGYAHSFTDVDDHWSEPVLGFPVHAKIIEGIGNNKFSPDGQLTTQEAILITYRAFQYFAN